jgi:hypothetical protein
MGKRRNACKILIKNLKERHYFGVPETRGGGSNTGFNQKRMCWGWV